MMHTLPPNVTRVIGYIRKSREEELQEERDPSFNALERQKTQMDRVLKKYEIPFDLEEEYGSGDKIDARPVFQKILRQISDGKYQAIAVREIQRLGRGSYEDMGTIYTLLEEKRIYVITENRIYDLRNPDDAKFIRMQLFMSREEYFFIKERLQGAREFFAGEGKFMSSRPPFGYVSNVKTKVLEIVEEQANYVRMVFKWYLEGDINIPQGLGYQAIATRLSSMGVKTYTGKKNWQPMHISTMLRNRSYIGEIIYKKTERRGTKQIERPKEEWIIAKNAHPAIINEEYFNQVQKKLDNKKSKLPIVLEFDPCELAGLVVCSCGYRMVRQYSVQHYKKSDGETSVYHKEFLYCRANCRSSIKYRDVENHILFALSEITKMSDKQIEEYFLKISSRYVDNESNTEIIEVLQKQEQSIRQKLHFIFEQYEDKVYSKEEFLARKSTLQTELDKVIVHIQNEQEKNQIDNNVISLDIFKANIGQVIDIYKSLSNKSLKNELLRSALDSVIVTVLEKGKGSRPSKLSVDIVMSKALVDSSFSA